MGFVFNCFFFAGKRAFVDFVVLRILIVTKRILGLPGFPAVFVVRHVALRLRRHNAAHLGLLRVGAVPSGGGDISCRRNARNNACIRLEGRSRRSRGYAFSALLD
jgi:hypothetical protein